MKGTKVPCDYASHHTEKEEFKYTREEKEELAIEQEEEDAEIWIIAVLEEEIKAFTQEELQKGTKEDPELVKILKEKQSRVKSKETSKGPYGKIWNKLRVYDRVLLTQKRVLVPKTLQNKAVTNAHGGNQSTTKTLGQLARASGSHTRLVGMLIVPSESRS